MPPTVPPPVPPLVLHHDLGRAAVAAGALALAATVVLGCPGPAGVVAGLALLALAWATLWRPTLRLDGAGLVVRNVVRDVHVPWSRLEAATFGWALELRTRDDAGRAVRVRVAACPGPRSMRALYERGVSPGGVFERDALHVAEPVAPALLAVRQRWEASRATPAADDAAARVRVAVLPVVLLALAVPAGAVAVILGSR